MPRSAGDLSRSEAEAPSGGREFQTWSQAKAQVGVINELMHALFVSKTFEYACASQRVELKMTRPTVVMDEFAPLQSSRVPCA